MVTGAVQTVECVACREALSRITAAKREILLATGRHSGDAIGEMKDDTVKAEAYLAAAMLLLENAYRELMDTPTGKEILNRIYKTKTTSRG